MSSLVMMKFLLFYVAIFVRELLYLEMYSLQEAGVPERRWVKTERSGGAAELLLTDRPVGPR